MVLPECREVPPVRQRATNLPGSLVCPRETRRHVLELAPELVTTCVRLRTSLVEERAGKDDAEERVAVQIVGRAFDDTQGGDHVGNDRIFGERAPVCEAARNPRVE